MTSAAAAFVRAQNDALRWRQNSVSTGLGPIDAITGGLLPGTLWLLTGPPGVGRSMLATQLAGRAAAHDADTVHVFLRDDPTDTALRLVANLAKVSLRGLYDSGLHSDDQIRLDDVQAVLSTLPLTLLSSHDVVHGLQLLNQVLVRVPAPRVVVIDDVDLFEHDVGSFDRLSGPDGDSGPGLPEQLRRWANRNQATVLVTRPSTPTTMLSGEDVPEPWLRASDVVLRLTDPSWLEPEIARHHAGEAWLTVLRNRRGPRMTVTLGVLADRAWFGELDPQPGQAMRREPYRFTGRSAGNAFAMRSRRQVNDSAVLVSDLSAMDDAGAYPEAMVVRITGRLVGLKAPMTVAGTPCGHLTVDVGGRLATCTVFPGAWTSYGGPALRADQRLDVRGRISRNDDALRLVVVGIDVID